VSLSIEKAHLINVLKGHKTLILNLSWNLDGKILATAGLDGLIRLWDMAEDGKEAGMLEGFTNYALCLSWGPDNHNLAAGTHQKTIDIWDIEKRKFRFSLRGHRDSVNTLSWSADGKWLASGSYDGEVKIWNLENGELLHTEHVEGSFSSCTVFSESKFIVLGDMRGAIYLLSKDSTQRARLEVPFTPQPEPEDEYDIPLQLIAALKSEDEGTRLGAIQSLEEYKDEHTVDAIGKLLEYDDKNIWDAAITSLVRIRTRHAGAVILRAVKFGHEGMESLIIIASGMLGGVIMAEPLVSAMEDEYPAVRKLAFHLLRIYVRMWGGLEKFVNNGYQHRDESTRQAVFDYLRRHGYS